MQTGATADTEVRMISSTRRLCFEVCSFVCLSLHLFVLPVFVIMPEVMSTCFMNYSMTSKEEVITFWERSTSYSGYKKNPKFSKVPFLMYFQ